MEMAIKNVILLDFSEKWKAYNKILTSPHHLLIFVEKGACAYRIEGTPYVVEKGDVLFIAEGLGRQGEAVNEDAHTKYSIHFTGDEVFQHFPDLNHKAVVFKTASIHSYLKQSYAHMYAIWAKKDMYFKPICEYMLLELLVRIHQESMVQQSSSKQPSLVQQVRNYITEYYREPLSIKELAHFANRSESHIITSFRKHYNMAPLEYMHRIRITKAEELLLTTEANIEKIAMELGYYDAAHFNRLFKKLTGMSPSMYRKLQ